MKKTLGAFIIVFVLILTSIGNANPHNRSSEQNQGAYSDDTMQYISENDVVLDNYDVQYNMANNLDNSFVLVGYAELDDYYNYGFRNLESKYFCLEITPIDGGYSNCWNIYVHRKEGETLYYYILDKGETYVETVCYIPKDRYKKNQGCLAMLEHASWGMRK